LNPNTGTEEQRAALGAMGSTQFNQKVYKYCSEKVAGFLSELIEEQQRPRDLAAMCMGPRIKCECATTGARDQTPACSAPCADRECDRDNCQPMLKVGGAIDATGCSCSRVDACGGVTPPAAEPPVCLNRVAAVLRRSRKRRLQSREPRATRPGLRRRQRPTMV
jgi:hypothetical protein